MISEQERLETKFTIADTATDIYIRNNGSFTIKETAREIGIEPCEIFNFFPDKTSILRFYYTALIFRYERMTEEIEKFDTYTISEKVSSFIFSSFDMLSEKQPFVDATFQPLILHPAKTTEFEREIKRLIEEFLYNDDRLSATAVLALKPVFYSFITKQYLLLVKFWLNDDSLEKEQTMELTDKLTSLFEELLYNTLVDKTVDLIKFMVVNRKDFITELPFLKKVLSNIEIR